MKESFQSYFKEKVIPLIVREHPEIVSGMILCVEGSVAAGIDDDLSDLDATIFLPDDLWKEHGGQLQLTLFHRLEPCTRHPYSGFSHDPFAWHNFKHSEIAIHPLSTLLCGKAESVLHDENDVPWDEVSVEELLQLQLFRVVVDARDVLVRLKEATTPDRYPERLWVKRLICELVDLAGEPEAFEKAVRRNKPLEAQMILGEILPRLFRVTFLINKRYYPWRRCFFRMFKELPFGPDKLLGEFETLGSDAKWQEKCQSVNRIIRTLTERILESGMLTADMLTFTFAAKRFRAWDDPGWFERYDAFCKQAEEAGYNWLDGWIWERWGGFRRGEIER